MELGFRLAIVGIFLQAADSQEVPPSNGTCCLFGTNLVQRECVRVERFEDCSTYDCGLRFPGQASGNRTPFMYKECILQGYQDLDDDLSPSLDFPINFLVFKNGKTSKFNPDGRSMYHPTKKYCFNLEPTDLQSLQTDFGNRISFEVMSCFTLLVESEEDPTIPHLYLGATTISTIFMLLTLGSFCLCHEIQNIHGWAQLTHVVCIFGLFFCWTIGKLINSLEMEGTMRCKVNGAIAHFFHISVYAWMTVVNFDLNQVFWKVNVRSGSRPCASTYLFYSTFAWGIPFLVVFTGITLSFIEIEIMGTPGSMILPGYGKESCFIAFAGVWAYVLAPNALLVLMAGVCFGKTIRIMFQRELGTPEEELEKQNIRTNPLFIKIFGLMAFAWVLDLIRALVSLINPGKLIPWYLILLDLVVLLQAIPIFVFYICRPHILNHLEAKYTLLWPLIKLIRKAFCVKVGEPQIIPITRLRMNRGSTVLALK